jgi:hypothetical protein
MGCYNGLLGQMTFQFNFPSSNMQGLYSGACNASWGGVIPTLRLRSGQAPGGIFIVHQALIKISLACGRAGSLRSK